ncbi:MAG TPA: putative quinol monooxygenase [Terracidiphilus sp.]|jgi:quinol monooxygenase YgiN|nr:putative quinol monooxygenase [Terracidiphilus sp.]
MLASVVRLTVQLTPNEGKLDEFKSIAQAMTEATKAEPGTLGYEWFSSGNGQFRLVETYVDAGAVRAHFLGPVVQKMVPRLASVCSVDGFEVYGDPGPEVGAMVVGFGAQIFTYWQGLDR